MNTATLVCVRLLLGSKFAKSRRKRTEKLKNTEIDGVLKKRGRCDLSVVCVVRGSLQF